LYTNFKEEIISASKTDVSDASQFTRRDFFAKKSEIVNEQIN